ncbi:VOC family protein [Pseudarthrobacter sp. Y6]|uniref:VOC family protein n=1 Tax=Pseudarthrobacter sp. Y6 TaxID=3418422 RepID=UPI003CF13D2C
MGTQQPGVEAAMHFYGGLFGWVFEDTAPSGATGRYELATLDGQEAGAITGPGTGVAAWNTYVSVDEADAATRHLLSVGATLKSAPAHTGSGGVPAVLADPEGAEYRIWQARGRPGAQAVNLPGGWNFSDLHTTDTEAAAAFYTKAFDWQFDNLDFGTMIRRRGYGDHLEATVDPNIRVRQSGDLVPAASRTLLPGLSRRRPVSDRTGTCRLLSQTGTVRPGMRSASAPSFWGRTIPRTRTVLIRDPGGAVFTASQYTPPTG